MVYQYFSRQPGFIAFFEPLTSTKYRNFGMHIQRDWFRSAAPRLQDDQHIFFLMATWSQPIRSYNFLVDFGKKKDFIWFYSI